MQEAYGLVELQRELELQHELQPQHELHELEQHESRQLNGPEWHELKRYEL